MSFQWNALPPLLLEALLAGSTGKAHLTRAALLALGTDSPLATLGVSLLSEAWAHDPLDSNLATQVLNLDQQIHSLPAQNKSVLKQAIKTQKPLQALHSELAHVRAAADHIALLKLAAQVRPLFPAGAAILMAEGHFLAGRFGRAEQACDDSGIQSARLLNLKAECALRQGNRQQAMDGYKTSLTLHPWQTVALMRLHDLATNLDQAKTQLRGNTAILLYSWNKADELDKTLASLAASDKGDAHIFTLDNGSTDATPQVMKAWARRLGDAFTSIRLPSNIGAPAARNWLMTIPEVRQSRWVAYLDDDIELEPDWLQRLGAATEAYPQAGVWGCKVVDRTNSATLQNADLHLRQPTEDSTLGRMTGHPTLFEVTDLQLQTPDLGQFDYIRTCASVTGCCHLFRTDRLLQAGEFDIRFSPTQFDDLEHDLQLLLNGHSPVYTGHLTTRHACLSGTKGAKNSAASGNAFGNQVKLQYKIGPDTARSLREMAVGNLLEDILTKQQTLGI